MLDSVQGKSFASAGEVEHFVRPSRIVAKSISFRVFGFNTSPASTARLALSTSVIALFPLEKVLPLNQYYAHFEQQCSNDETDFKLFHESCLELRAMNRFTCIIAARLPPDFTALPVMRDGRMLSDEGREVRGKLMTNPRRDARIRSR